MEQILKKRTFGYWKKKQYLIRWKGYLPAHDSWVNTKDLNALELLAEFKQQPASIRTLLSDNQTPSCPPTPTPSSTPTSTTMGSPPPPYLHLAQLMESSSSEHIPLTTISTSSPPSLTSNYMTSTFTGPVLCPEQMPQTLLMKPSLSPSTVTPAYSTPLLHHDLYTTQNHSQQKEALAIIAWLQSSQKMKSNNLLKKKSKTQTPLPTSLTADTTVLQASTSPTSKKPSKRTEGTNLFEKLHDKWELCNQQFRNVIVANWFWKRSANTALFLFHIFPTKYKEATLRLKL